jgi:uncharacterized protein (TIGR03032 family)
MYGSERLWNWLNESQISLVFTTYQTNRLFLVGINPEGRLAVNERLFDKPMGLFAESRPQSQGQRLWMSTRYQLWQLENRLGPGEQHQGGDRLYIPSLSHTTGDLNVHDVVVDAQGRVLFVNTDFSCLATLCPGYSFEPIWQPPFITKLVAEDRCHLNGLALVEGQPTYMTACSSTNEAAGWRNHRVGGGVVMHLPSHEIIAQGLSMPHSPRWYQGKLWLLNSGTGELGYLDGEQFVPITFCPGFVRGLAFWDRFALVGLSKLRSKTFGGLALETRLAAQGQTPQCGLMVVDLTTGTIVHGLSIEGVVEELFDVVVLPGVRQPRAIGFQSEDIDRLVTFPGSGGIITTKPTVKRPGLGAPVQTAGLPRLSQNQSFGERVREQDPQVNPVAPVKFQRVYHLTPENLLPYEAMTFPSLRDRWQSQPQKGELLGISASVAGEMVGFAVAERSPDQTAELLSLFVLPAYRQQGIGSRLVQQLEQDLGQVLGRGLRGSPTDCGSSRRLDES